MDRFQKEKVHYIDTSKADNFRQINEGLKKAAKDIESFTKKGFSSLFRTYSTPYYFSNFQIFKKAANNLFTSIL